MLLLAPQMLLLAPQVLLLAPQMLLLTVCCCSAADDSGGGGGQPGRAAVRFAACVSEFEGARSKEEEERRLYHARPSKLVKVYDRAPVHKDPPRTSWPACVWILK